MLRNSSAKMQSELGTSSPPVVTHERTAAFRFAVVLTKRRLMGAKQTRLILRWNPLSAPGRIASPTANVICPLLSGPKLVLFWIMKEIGNAIEEAQAGGDYRQAS